MLARAGRTSQFTLALSSFLVACALGWLVPARAPAVPAPVNDPVLTPATPAEPGRELRPKWTSTSRTWVDDNGQLVSRIYPVPVNFRDGKGAWQAVGMLGARGLG
jgi:hypothetical protein